MKTAVILALVAGCTGPRYLGAPLPSACTARDAEHCAGWMAERELDAGELDVYDDARLHDYVQGIAERLARGTALPSTPHVVIADHDGTYAAFGDRIVIGRMAIEKLGTEAELAGIVAHELVHVEGHHATVSLYGPETDDAWLAARRDAEAIADERAVTLLERAGYTPVAMQRALGAELSAEDDPEHPTRNDRLSRVAALAAGTEGGFEGRAEMLSALDKMIVGRDTRLGVRVGKAWVISSLELAIDLPADDTLHGEGDALIVRHGRSQLAAYAIGSPWAEELGGKLEQRGSASSALGTITVGVAPEPQRPDLKPLDKLEGAVRALLPQPVAGAHVVIVNRERGALVIELSPHSEVKVRDAWLHGLRAATETELRAAEPPRIWLTPATRGGTIRDAVAACPNPERALGLDDPGRPIVPGEVFKCTDR